MRRVLFVLLAAVPALAVGQSAGGIILQTSDSSDLQVVNRAQCSGTSSNEEVGLTEDVTASITFTIKPVDTFTATGTYKVYVMTSRPAAGQTRDSEVQSSCITNLSGDSIAHAQISSNITVTGQTMTTTSDVALSSIVAAAGISSCDGTTQQTFYMCVQQLEGSTELGWAIATLSMDPTIPPAPRNLSASPGDGVLHVKCSAGSGDTDSDGTFKAKAIPRTAGLPIRFSGESSDCDDLRVTGLTNNEVYDVVAYRLGDNHNPSVASTAIEGTPIPTEDYWDHYDGQEQGGCSTGGTAAGVAGGLALLAGLSLLAALRRRNS